MVNWLIKKIILNVPKYQNLSKKVTTVVRDLVETPQAKNE